MYSEVFFRVRMLFYAGISRVRKKFTIISIYSIFLFTLRSSAPMVEKQSICTRVYANSFLRRARFLDFCIRNNVLVLA
jgi:hypothetical protein